MRKLLLLVAIVIVGFIVYALAWPSRFDPQAWRAPDAASAQQGAFATHQPVDGLMRLARGIGNGPETVAIDNQGRLYAGYDDGTIRRFDPQGEHPKVFATTNGRPLGMHFGPPLPATKQHNPPPGTPSADVAATAAAKNTGDNKSATASHKDHKPKRTLYVADADKGLLAINGQGDITVLATGADGTPFDFTDDVDVAANGQVYFTDASSKYGSGHYRSDILEHGGHGRLLNYNPATGKTRVLMSGLQFANGVAVGPKAKYVLVSETGSYRVMRHWLRGPRAGANEVFIDNLPGFPDGISFNGDHEFWLALFAPRNAILDFTSSLPWLRRIIYHLPPWLQPKPARETHIVGLAPDGQVNANLVDTGKKAYAPVTSVVQNGQQLYLGSLLEASFAHMPVPATAP